MRLNPTRKRERTTFRKNMGIQMSSSWFNAKSKKRISSHKFSFDYCPLILILIELQGSILLKNIEKMGLHAKIT
jgi:hypothetical protein